MQKFLWAACGTFFVNGLTNAVLGPMVPKLMSHYHVSYTAPGYLVFAQFLGFLVGVPVCAQLARKFGVRPVLWTACLGLAVALSVLTWKPPFYVFYICMAVSGLSVGGTESVIAARIMEAFVGRRAVTMSYLEVSYGLGALVSPTVASVFLKIQHWPLSFLTVGLAGLLVVVLWSAARPDEQSEQSEQVMHAEHQLDAETRPAKTLSRRSEWLLLSIFLLITLLYTGSESSLNSFLPAILMAYLHIPAYLSALSVSALWAAMVLGRVATSFVIRRVRYAPFLVVSSAGMASSLVILSLMRAPFFTYLAVFILGLFMAGIYSINLVMANHSTSISPRLVTSLVTVFGGIGAGILPITVGFTLNHTSPFAALQLIAAAAALLLVCFMTVSWSVRNPIHASGLPSGQA